MNGSFLHFSCLFWTNQSRLGERDRQYRVRYFLVLNRGRIFYSRGGIRSRLRFLKNKTWHHLRLVCAIGGGKIVLRHNRTLRGNSNVNRIRNRHAKRR